MSNLKKREEKYLQSIIDIADTHSKARRNFKLIYRSLFTLGIFGVFVEVVAYFVLDDRDLFHSVGNFAIGTLIGGGAVQLSSLKGLNILYPHINIDSIKSAINEQSK